MLNKIYVITEDGLMKAENVKTERILMSDGIFSQFGNVDHDEKSIATFTPANIHPTWLGNDPIIIIHPPNSRNVMDKIYMDIDKWVKFFGIWLIRGSIASKTYGLYRKVVITTRVEIDDIIPFHYTRYDNDVSFRYEIYNTQLANGLAQFGDKKTRCIPKYMKNATDSTLNTLIKWIWFGSDKNDKIYTQSGQFSDDLIEIMAKSNINMTISLWKSGTHVISKKEKLYDNPVSLFTWKPKNKYVYLLIDGHGGWYKYEN